MRHLISAATDWQVPSSFLFLVICLTRHFIAFQVWLHILVYMSVVTPRK